MRILAKVSHLQSAYVPYWAWGLVVRVLLRGS